MILQCENCRSRFNLDESLLKEGGSKVRCSQCRSVFQAFPPKGSSTRERSKHGREREDGQETVILDSLSDLGEVSSELESVNSDLVSAAFPDDPVPPFAALATGRRRSVLPALLLGLILLFGAGFGVYHMLASGRLQEIVTFLKPRAERTQVDSGVRRLSFQGVNGSFILAEDKKQRFVIRGAIVNNYPDPRSFIVVKASVLDGQGRTVSSRTVYAGNYFSQGELMGRSIEFLEERSNRARGEQDSNVAVPAGGRVPFMVVFQDLPRDISEFTVEGVSSSPAFKD